MWAWLAIADTSLDHTYISTLLYLGPLLKVFLARVFSVSREFLRFKSLNMFKKLYSSLTRAR